MTNVPYLILSRYRSYEDDGMRKQQKAQIEEMIGLLAQAHGEIEKAVGTGKKEEALAILAQCQDSAIQLGSFIEQMEGEGCTTIGVLERYCDLVYEAYEAIGQNQFAHINNKVFKKLRKALIQAENSVKNDIRIRKVAVFLPYKASMWDSLESIWKAAEEDPDCDAYVIPIPYYDKNPDGSFREMHYEGDQYPDYVPVTDYNSFDFGTQQPDMIFIHNPYDEWNYVTSVHPFFYSSNLKKFTEKLVYIPYFILGEVEPDDHEAVKGMEHFCTVPAVVHADRVVVQSEKMRQIYINVMSKTMGEDTRKVWEKKILGLGSPKVDKVLNTRKENLEIPEDWLKVIEKPDGSFKKIIFYNTSVVALLKHEEKMLRKMQSVFEIFKEHRDEAALLWRPHPLIQATIESMRPQLWEAYREVKERYVEEGWGIYDDTADMDRAVVLSDGYYGDASSVVQLYKMTQKNVFIQKLY